MSIFLNARSHRISTIVVTIIGILLVIVGSLMVAEKIAPVSWGWWGDINNSNGVAIDGYDVVAYHTDRIATKGDVTNSYTWNNVVWHFRSEKNKTLFQADPEKYIPQYGGYCAFAVSEGVTADASADSWHIKDGKLYLLSDDTVKASWLNEIENGIIKRAGENWLKR